MSKRVIEITLSGLVAALAGLFFVNRPVVTTPEAQLKVVTGVISSEKRGF